jgi:hypothetical protein
VADGAGAGDVLLDAAPEMAIVTGDEIDQATILTEVDQLPELVGRNHTWKFSCWSGARETPGVKPLTENAELPTEMDWIFKLTLPVLRRLRVWKFEEPEARVPKPTEVGEAFRAGAAFSPVPERETLSGSLMSGLRRIRAPSTEATEAGAKETVRLALAPGARDAGSLAEAKWKPAPET